jgi:hypothetical protein
MKIEPKGTLRSSGLTLCGMAEPLCRIGDDQEMAFVAIG